MLLDGSLNMNPSKSDVCVPFLVPRMPLPKRKEEGSPLKVQKKATIKLIETHKVVFEPHEIVIGAGSNSRKLTYQVPYLVELAPSACTDVVAASTAGTGASNDQQAKIPAKKRQGMYRQLLAFDQEELPKPARPRSSNGFALM